MSEWLIPAAGALALVFAAPGAAGLPWSRRIVLAEEGSLRVELLAGKALVHLRR